MRETYMQRLRKREKSREHFHDQCPYCGRRMYNLPRHIDKTHNDQFEYWVKHTFLKDDHSVINYINERTES